MYYKIMNRRFFILIPSSEDELNKIRTILDVFLTFNKRNLDLKNNQTSINFDKIKLFAEIKLTSLKEINSLNVETHTSTIFLVPLGMIKKTLETLHKAEVKIENPEFVPSDDFLSSFYMSREDDKLQYNIKELEDSGYKLKYKQDECIRKISESYCGGIINAATSFGKSWIISFCCKLFKDKKIAVVSHSRAVCLSLYRLISKVLYPEKVGLISGNSNTKGRVTVYTARSLIKSSFDEDIVFIDEIHHGLTEKLVSTLVNFTSSRIFGFSASMDMRFDNADIYAYSLCGPKIFSLPYSEARDKGIVSKLKILWIPLKSGCKEYKSLVLKKRHCIWRNEIRNKKVAEISNVFFNLGQQVLILVETVEHCLELSQYLPKFELCYGEGTISKKLYKLYKDKVNIQRMTRKRMEYLMNGFEKRRIMGVISTYVWSTGVSFDDLNVLVRADGSASSIRSIQIPGRAARIGKETDKDTAIIVDFIDFSNKNLVINSLKRFLDYNNEGFEQYILNSNEKIKDRKDFIIKAKQYL